MPYPKSDMRAGAEQAVASAQAHLKAVLERPEVAADGSALLVTALGTYDHNAARSEARRLAMVHPEVGEAWKSLDDAIKFLAFGLLTDLADGEESG